MNPSPIIPDHTLLRPIGRGAYGEVWLARNIMGTPRAVKIVWRSQFESERPYEREFAGVQRYEPVSRTTGGLVHLLHVGRDDAAGYFYYVMELADDAAVPTSKEGVQVHTSIGPGSWDFYAPRTLRSEVARLGRLSTHECLRVALEAVSGLAQLHRQGLVHRDVKPGNIIFVGGRAKLADIGLITAHGETRTFVGTAGYIAPEGPGSVQADLYALGVSLFEASTGLQPEKFPDIPPEWLADSAGDESLEFHEIVLRACEGQREQRYRTAEEMQADLALLQSGQSVRRLRALERRAAVVRKFAWASGFVVIIALGIALYANARAKVEAANRAKEKNLREQAQHSQFRAESAERLAR